jgi:hypothetical protein
MTNIGAASDANYYIDRWILTPEGNAIVTRRGAGYRQRGRSTTISGLIRCSEWLN